MSVPTRLAARAVELPAGTPLLTALGTVLADTNARSAVGELVGGELAAFSYFIPDIGPQGGPVATFSAPRAGVAPGRLVRGGLTLGHRAGEVFCHSHALFTGADGVARAGHLIPESVLLGAGVHARVWTSADVAIEVQTDPETTMSLFTPRRVLGPERDGVPAVVCRVRPNTDLVGVVERLTADQGWTGADVRGQIGSLVGGCLEQPDGTVREIDGPATEVMFLDGAMTTIDDNPTTRLAAHLVDRHAQVHSGLLVRGRNPVGMTYELALTEAVDR